MFLTISQKHFCKYIEEVIYKYLAFNHYDSSFVVNANSTRMLKNVSSELANELSVLVVDLYLVSG